MEGSMEVTANEVCETDFSFTDASMNEPEVFKKAVDSNMLGTSDLADASPSSPTDVLMEDMLLEMKKNEPDHRDQNDLRGTQVKSCGALKSSDTIEDSCRSMNAHCNSTVVDKPTESCMDKDTAQCEGELHEVSPDSLPTILEIVGVDSANDSLPDDVHQPYLDDTPSPSLHKRQSPLGAFLHSERKSKLRKAAAKSDFEMQQLNHQIAQTKQYTKDIMALRNDQSKLEKKLREQKEEIASRNDQLRQELRQLEESAAQISHAEAEVAMLAEEYKAQLQRLGQQQVQLRFDIMRTAQPSTFGNQASHNSMGSTQADSSQNGEYAAEDITNQQIPSVEYRANDGFTNNVQMYSKGTCVYYKSTGSSTEMPAIILDVRFDYGLDPYYSIRLENGQEMQTDNAHLRPLEIGVLSHDDSDLASAGKGPPLSHGLCFA